jgi:hypothetical protein
MGCDPQFLGAMNEDRDTGDPDGGSTTERRTKEGVEGTCDVWARAAEQARRDMARAQQHAAAREQGSAKSVIP